MANELAARRRRFSAVRLDGMLRDSQFRLLLSARLSSLFGTGMAPIAVAFAALQLRNSPSAVALLVGAQMTAQVALMLVGGVFADRLRRYRVMVTADLCAGGAQAIAAVLLLTGKGVLWELAVLEAIVGGASAFLLPALQGVVPEIVDADQRQEANAILGLARDVGRLGGVALGGVLVAAFGGGIGLAIDGASYLLSAVLTSGLRIPSTSRLTKSPLLHDLAVGWSDFRRTTWAWTITLQSSVVNAIGMGSFLILGPVVAKQWLGGAGQWTLVIGGFTAGLILGGVAATRVHLPQPLFVAPVSSLLLALPLLLLGTRAFVPLIAGSAVLFGVAWSMFNAAFGAALQTHVHPDRVSRVSSYAMFGSFVSIPLGTVVIGVCATVAGSTTTLVAAAVAVAAVSVPLLIYPRFVALPASGVGATAT